MQMRLQKVVLLGAAVIAGLVFFYALGFSTNLYSLSYHMDASSTLFYVPGAEIYAIVQPFNKALFGRAVLYLLTCLTLFVTLTHRRRLYYPANYITSLAAAGFSVYMGYDILTHAVDYKAQYLQVDFEKLREVTEMMNMKYVESTFMLDVGIGLSFLLFVLAGLLCLNLLLKTLWMRREVWAEEATA